MVKSVSKLPAIGVMGGTFDPVHYGHLRTAVEVYQHFRLDAVRLIPNAVAPHRPQPQASAAQRQLMLSLAIKNTPFLQLDDRELNRQGVSYTVDTLQTLRVEFAANPLFLILGSDAFAELFSWSRWQLLLSLCHIVVINRVGQASEYSNELSAWLTEHRGEDQDKTLPFGKVWPLTVTHYGISATQIRHALQTDQPVNFLLPDAVLSLIEQLGLYQSTTM